MSKLLLKQAARETILPARKHRRRPCSGPAMEPLDGRVMMAVTASLSAARGVLTITGDAQNNSIAVSFNAAGSIVVNGDGIIVPIQGGTPTAANTRLIHESRTRAYGAKRTAQGKTRKEIIRCLKRYIARELYPLVLDALTAAAPTT